MRLIIYILCLAFNLMALGAWISGGNGETLKLFAIIAVILLVLGLVVEYLEER